MILPFTVIILIILCVYMSYDKKLSKSNKIAIILVAIIGLVLCYQYMKQKREIETYYNYEEGSRPDWMFLTETGGSEHFHFHALILQSIAIEWNNNKINKTKLSGLWSDDPNDLTKFPKYTTDETLTSFKRIITKNDPEPVIIRDDPIELYENNSFDTSDFYYNNWDNTNYWPKKWKVFGQLFQRNISPIYLGLNSSLNININAIVSDPNSEIDSYNNKINKGYRISPEIHQNLISEKNYLNPDPYNNYMISDSSNDEYAGGGAGGSSSAGRTVQT